MAGRSGGTTAGPKRASGLLSTRQEVTLLRLQPGQWRRWRELRLAALAESPHAFCTRLSDWQGDGDTEDRWRSRLAEVPCNLAANLGGRPCGMVSGTGPDSHGDAELLSLWVAPDARGRGVGDALVEAVAGWAEAEGAMVLVLTVRATNAAAISLYRRHGFADAGSVTRPDGEPADLRMTRPLAHPVPRPS